MKIKTKKDKRVRIQLRQRKRISGTKERPRLSVFRSVAHIYAQVIDDLSGQTLASASTVDSTLKGKLDKGVRGGNLKGAEAVGTLVRARFPALADCIGTPAVAARLNRALHFAVQNELPVLTPQVYVGGTRLCDEDTDLGLDYVLARLLDREGR